MAKKTYKDLMQQALEMKEQEEKKIGAYILKNFTQIESYNDFNKVMKEHKKDIIKLIEEKTKEKQNSKMSTKTSMNVETNLNKETKPNNETKQTF